MKRFRKGQTAVCATSTSERETRRGRARGYRAFFVLAALLAVLPLTLTLAVPAGATAGFTYQNDEGGANDQVGQKDLTRQGVNDSGLPTSLGVEWNWDETSIPGGNTLDGCALLDTDGDLNANNAVCVTAGGSPLAFQAVTLWTCSDKAPDKCTSPSSTISSPSTTCTVSKTSTDPFAAGADYPNDTTANCNVILADFGGGTAELINTCSYESASPTSNPEDCVLVPRDAFLTIVKVASPDDSTQFPFTLDSTAVFTATCSETSSAMPIASTVTISGIDAKPADDVTCTFNDTQNNPSLSIDKSSTTTSITAAGQVVPYSYLVTNTGNVSLTGVTVTDSKADAPGVSCPQTTLAVGANMTCTASHTVTQAEIDAGGNLSNTGIADSDQTGPAQDSLDIPIAQSASLSIDKSSTTTSITAAGQVVPYSYLVTNTGNVSLTGVTVTDSKADAPGVSCPQTTLAVGANMTCTASHTVTQAEIDAGGNLSNTGIADSNRRGRARTR